MAVKNNSRSKTSPSSSPLAAMPMTDLAEQERRRYISNTWRPRGFNRYTYQNYLLNQMPVLDGMQTEGANPQRFQPVGRLEDQ
jgi:hypothetical protein